MHFPKDEQPYCIGVPLDKPMSPSCSEIYFSKHDYRGYSGSFGWEGGGCWRNNGGDGWYILGPLNLVEWGE